MIAKMFAKVLIEALRCYLKEIKDFSILLRSYKIIKDPVKNITVSFSHFPYPAVNLSDK